jgi:cell wall-associated NlpC family hydrolase
MAVVFAAQRPYPQGMPVLAAGEIYRYALLAGFSPDEAVTMTAIALAESGGNTRAHNPHGEDSRGLWQINAAVHPKLHGHDLYDPLTNAQAAYDVSSHGRDISRWTVAHGSDEARYLHFRDEAELAARMAGDTAHGNWSGVSGYSDRAPAAGDPDATTEPEPAADDSGSQQVNDLLTRFLEEATAQVGDRYVYGAETKISDPNPHAFDCSELVQWAAGRVGIDVGDGATNQYVRLRNQDATMSVEEAIRTPGALLFKSSSTPGEPLFLKHVAISMGDGRTVEAANPRKGVLFGEAEGRFTHAAMIPGLTGGSHATVASDPVRPDSDGDGISDEYERSRSHSNPFDPDSDHDGSYDAEELSNGTKLLDPDSDRDGREDGATGRGKDSDGDSLSDRLERALRLDARHADSDGDGFADGAEYFGNFDPASATSSPLFGVGVEGEDGEDVDHSAAI